MDPNGSVKDCEQEIVHERERKRLGGGNREQGGERAGLVQVLPSPESETVKLPG